VARRILLGSGAGIFFAIAAATVVGCGSDGSNPGTGVQMSNAPAAKFSDIYAMAFPSMTEPRCEFCHGMPANEVSNGKLHLGMDPATAYAALVGKVSVSAACMGRTLVDPGHPETSLFYLKLSPSPPCGNRMPNGGKPFTDVQLEMVRSWIAAGAAND
jgi:hypothetical protein